MVSIEVFYLIDYENVHGDGLSGCQDLGKTDHIVIFFTQNAKNISMSDISNHGQADLEMIEVPAGKQSADIHIGSYMGILAGKYGKNCKVVIVSKDTDFDNVIKFCKEKTGISASRTQQIKKKPATTKTTTDKTSETPKKATTKINGERKTKLNQEVMQAVRGAKYTASVSNTVAQIVSGLYGEDNLLSKVHNALKERYSNYLDIYAVIKPIVSKYSEDKQKQEKSKATTNVKSPTKTEINSEIQKALSNGGFSNDIIAYVTSTAVKNLDIKNGKQQTYRAIISKYGQNKGLNIYNHIKKHI